MPVELPFEPSTPLYQFSTTLEETQFIFVVRWNGRNASWYIDLYDENGVIIRYGTRVVLGTFLAARTADPRRPRGALIAADLSGVNADAGFDDMGTRVVVLYYTPEELAEL